MGRHWPWSGQGRLYVVGDIHGCADLLDRMAGRIADDLAARPVPESLVVTVGDYIDRGPDSAGVIERLMRNPFPTAYVALKGNHEVLLEDFLAVPATAAALAPPGRDRDAAILRRGASTTVPAGRSYVEAARALGQAVPPAHRDFVASLDTSLTVGRLFHLPRRRATGRPARSAERGGSVVDPRAVPGEPRRFRQDRRAWAHAGADARGAGEPHQRRHRRVHERAAHLRGDRRRRRAVRGRDVILKRSTILSIRDDHRPMR